MKKSKPDLCKEIRFSPKRISCLSRRGKPSSAEYSSSGAYQARQVHDPHQRQNYSPDYTEQEGGYPSSNHPLSSSYYSYPQHPVRNYSYTVRSPPHNQSRRYSYEQDYHVYHDSNHSHYVDELERTPKFSSEESYDLSCLSGMERGGEEWW